MTSAQPKSTTLNDEDGALAGKRILLVEDDLLISTLAVELMQLKGIAVIGPAETLSAALALVEREPLDAAVLDLNLGSETSFAVAATLKAQGTPFFYTTAFANATHPDVLGEMLLAKPYGAKQFFRMLETLLSTDTQDID